MYPLQVQVLNSIQQIMHWLFQREKTMTNDHVPLYARVLEIAIVFLIPHISWEPRLMVLALWLVWFIWKYLTLRNGDLQKSFLGTGAWSAGGNTLDGFVIGVIYL